jgi:hypothetical protein
VGDPKEEEEEEEEDISESPWSPYAIFLCTKFCIGSDPMFKIEVFNALPT